MRMYKLCFDMVIPLDLRKKEEKAARPTTTIQHL